MQLAASAGHPGTSSALSRAPATVQSELLVRASRLAADFGRHDTARSYLVLAMQLGGEAAPVTVARAIASPEATTTALNRLEHGVVDAADPLSAAYVARALQAEAGITDSKVNDGSLGPFEAWCRTDRLEDQAGRLSEIAEDPAIDLRLRLLADTIILITCATLGRAPEAHVKARARLAFEAPNRPGSPRTALRRDANATYLLTLSVIDLLCYGSVRLDSYREELSRLEWAGSHTKWLRLFESASLAFNSGNAGQAAVEWQQMLELLPRFAAPRITQAISQLLPIVSAPPSANTVVEFSQTYSGMVVAHWIGDLTTAAKLDPGSLTDASLQSPMLHAIREVIAWHEPENPVQLTRASDMLAELG